MTAQSALRRVKFQAYIWGTSCCVSGCPSDMSGEASSAPESGTGEGESTVAGSGGGLGLSNISTSLSKIFSPFELAVCMTESPWQVCLAGPSVPEGRHRMHFPLDLTPHPLGAKCEISH